MKIKYILLAVLAISLISCKKTEIDDPNPNEEGPQLIFKIVLDSNQERLDAFGQPETIPAGHAAQNPQFNKVAIHSIELVPNAYTQFEEGEMLYFADYIMENGMKSIIFNKLDQVKSGDVVYTIPLKDVTPGTYEYIRSSVAYQNYDVDFEAMGFNLTGTIASFVAHMSFIETYKIKTKTVTVNASEMQGYYGVEIPAIPPYYNGEVITGNTAGTTVVNPISATSPLPETSCTITGIFGETFEITGNETEDIIIELSFSINNSFEWTDADGNGVFNPLDGDQVVDMGLRGLIPYVIK